MIFHLKNMLFRGEVYGINQYYNPPKPQRQASDVSLCCPFITALL